MSLREAACPACGAPLEFLNAATLYVVCPYCGGAASRIGQDLEKIGKVAEIAPIESPFELRMRAALKDKPYTVVGQIQLDHGAGPWNEWCIVFDDGKWAWLAEAQGQYIFTREIEVPSSTPPWGMVHPGEAVHLGGGGEFSVSEVGTARVVAALGELPVRVDPGSEVRYLDLQGAGRAVATVDYGDGDTALAVYTGRTVDVDDLGLPREALEKEHRRRVEASRIACPQCAGQVDLLHPTEAMRAVCRSCGSLLDPRAGHLKALGKAWSVKARPCIPLGTRGSLRGRAVEVIAFLVRSVKSDGVRYPWEEYLLRLDDGGYRWLTLSDGHWSFVEPISAGDYRKSHMKLHRDGKTYKHFQGGVAVVDHVQGEVYWEVAVGETTSTDDYVAPPEMISVESSKKEINPTLCTYIERDEVWSGLGLDGNPPPCTGVAPNQPNPLAGRRRPWWLAYGAMAAVTVILAVFFHVRASNEVVFEGGYAADRSVTGSTAPPSTPDEAGRVVITHPFTLKEAGNLRFELVTDVNNDWLGVDGALVNLTTGDVQSFTLLAQYYHGVSDGESWSEGSRSAKTWLGPIEPGDYVLRWEPATDAKPGLVNYSLEVRTQDAAEGRPLLVLLLLVLGPIVPTLGYTQFESRRWANSDHAHTS